MREKICILTLAVMLIMANIVQSQDATDYNKILMNFYAKLQKLPPLDQFSEMASVLKKYPEIPQSERLISMISYFLETAPKIAGHAEALISDYLKAEGRSERQISIAKRVLMLVKAELGKTDDVLSLLGAMNTSGLNLYDADSVLKALIRTELFTEALQIINQQKEVLDLESLIKQLKGKEDLARSIYNRNKAIILAYEGACFAGLEKYEDALKILDKSISLEPVSVVGKTDTLAVFYKGLVFHKMGDFARAMDTLLPVAVYWHDEKYLAALERVYLDHGGKPEDFSAFLEGKRYEIAQTAPDFTLEKLGSDGEVTLSNYFGKVIILNFWSYG